MYSMQFSLTLWTGSVQLFDFLIMTIRHHDVIVSKTSKTTTAYGYLLYAHSKQTKSTQKTQRKRHQNTAHSRQSGNETAQGAEKVIEHTVPDKNRSGALNAMRSTRRETKETREVERAMRDATETGQTRSRASSARRNGTKGSRAKNAQRKKKRDGGERRGEKWCRKVLC